MLSEEIEEHLFRRLIPFWVKLRDREQGGFYGWMDSSLHVDRTAEKGCILNSRILWFFSNAYMCLRMQEDHCMQEETVSPETGFGKRRDSDAGSTDAEEAGSLERALRESAEWAYRFLKEKCLDRERGGVYWSVNYKGEPEDTTKHTYNQAFAVYALSSCFRAFHDREALKLAEELIRVIETRCFDVHGYREAQDRDFRPISNDKLSENGVMAEHTMNTLLHVLEAYTEYLLACREAKACGQDAAEDSGICGLEKLVEAKLRWILHLIKTRVYNPGLHRQEVFFNQDMESLIDLHSYGHDIEAAWLMDRCLDVLGDEALTVSMSPILRDLENEVYEKAYRNHSLENECERGVTDGRRVWWVQAEGVVGFYNAWGRTGEQRYLEAARDIWAFIREHLADKREGGEWFWYTDAAGNPALERPIVEPWKCPYHNGRMCMEIISRK